jgi:hypothetical protein
MENMKSKAVLALGLLATLFGASAQGSNELARVRTLDGKQIYILNEPLRSYEHVGSVKTGLKFSSVLTRGLLNENVNDKTAQFALKAVNKLKKENVEYDAILYSEGKSVHAIRFTEEATPAKDGLARINELNGIGLFVLADPVRSYEVEASVKSGLNIVPFLTHGLINPSIEKDMTRFARRASKRQSTSYISYQMGRRAAVISMRD